MSILYPVIHGKGIGVERGFPLNGGVASISKNIRPCAPMSLISGETCFDTNRKNMIQCQKILFSKRGDFGKKRYTTENTEDMYIWVNLWWKDFFALELS